MHWFYRSCSTKIEGTVRPVKGQCGDTWWLERERQKELGTRKAEKNVSISALALCKHGSAPSALAEGRPPVCIWRCVFIVSGSVRRDSDLKPTGLVVLKETIHQRSQWRRIPLNMYVCVHLFLHAGALFFLPPLDIKGEFFATFFARRRWSVCVLKDGRHTRRDGSPIQTR